jgi:hypothetical protein
MGNLALFLSEQKGRLGEAESLHRRVCARWAKRCVGRGLLVEAGTV